MQPGIVRDAGEISSPFSRTAAIKFSGTPHVLNPPARIVATVEQFFNRNIGVRHALIHRIGFPAE